MDGLTQGPTEAGHEPPPEKDHVPRSARIASPLKRMLVHDKEEPITKACRCGKHILNSRPMCYKCELEENAKAIALLAELGSMGDDEIEVAYEETDGKTEPTKWLVLYGEMEKRGLFRDVASDD